MTVVIPLQKFPRQNDCPYFAKGYEGQAVILLKDNLYRDRTGRYPHAKV